MEGLDKKRRQSHFCVDYYPYGLSYHRFERTAQEFRNKYGYQGKEYLDEEGLDTYDFHARFYDPAMGRFTTLDPKASEFATMSPYLGMGANPNMYVDPDGQELTLLAAIAIGAAIGGGVGAASYGISTAVNGDAWNWGDFGISFGTGAISGALTTAGSAFGPAGMVLGGSVAGGINSSIGGGSFGRGAWTGAVGTGVGLGFSSAVDVNGIIPGALFGSATGGLTSGGLTALQGGDFWSGFEQGAISGGISGGIGGYLNSMRSDRGTLFGERLSGKRLIRRDANSGRYLNDLAAYENTEGIGCCGELYSQDSQDNLKFHSRGMLAKGGWTTEFLGPIKFEAGQIVRVKFTNKNVLPVTFKLRWNNPAYQDPSSHYILPGESTSVQGSIFAQEPIFWNFDVSTVSDVILLQYEIHSTWVPQN
ncbi:MAG: RHS repeat-associated core domain-containing protein [Bacteroidota bacterium]